MQLVRCEWCAVPLLPADAVKDNRGAHRCADGASCAVRAGELLWATSLSEASRYGGSLSGRYCCLNQGCNHPKEQVFNGGAE